MTDRYANEPLLDMFIFETSQLLEQLEQAILSSEKVSSYSGDTINEIFRIMHTIKGSSAMMRFQNISSLAHSIEDLFYYLRESKPASVDYFKLSDMVLDGVDFIKTELEKIKLNQEVDGNSTSIIDNLKEYLAVLKQENHRQITEQSQVENPEEKILESNKFTYEALIFFEEGCEMENIRAYSVIQDLKNIADEILYQPEDIMENDDSVNVIQNKGFRIFIKTDSDYDKVYQLLSKTVFLKEFNLKDLHQQKSSNNATKQIILTEEENHNLTNNQKKEEATTKKEINVPATGQSIISVSVSKLDKLMDLVGEMVIAESMVIQNPDLKDLTLDNFQKAARQLSKITSEIQDMVMSIRMVPLAATFHKMHRVIRDMNKKLDKEVELEIIGEDTEVDKNIIEHISDPIMHLVRNAVDHGIESSEERISKGKSKHGTIILEARNSGSDVLVTVRDDGRGLHKTKIIEKARKNGLLFKDDTEMTDKEIYNLILLPGFSTKEHVSEFSGRGVGMDVVLKNIEAIGGTLLVDSIEGKGSVITLKLPLTLAIIDGMTIKVGNTNFTIPTNTIKEIFRAEDMNIISDPDENEMIMVRGQCYPILRLHSHYKLKTDITSFHDGIFIMLEQEESKMCIFADEIIGQQQVVVKALPEYINQIGKIRGIEGCTMLGDGSISLIMDMAGLSKK